MGDLDPFLHIGGGLCSLESFDEGQGMGVCMGMLFRRGLLVDCVVKTVGIIRGYLIAGEMKLRGGLHEI